MNKSGRLKTMEDQSRKLVLLKWNNKLNKPEEITRKGLGSIRIIYDRQGPCVEYQRPFWS